MLFEGSGPCCIYHFAVPQIRHLARHVSAALVLTWALGTRNMQVNGKTDACLGDGVNTAPHLIGGRARTHSLDQSVVTITCQRIAVEISNYSWSRNNGSPTCLIMMFKR